jgi:hypothetical protein
MRDVRCAQLAILPEDKSIKINSTTDYQETHSAVNDNSRKPASFPQREHQRRDHQISQARYENNIPKSFD